MDTELQISIFFRTVSNAFAHSGGSRSGSSPDSLLLRENTFSAHTVAEKKPCRKTFRNTANTGGGSRTHMSLLTMDFESIVSAIPPLRQKLSFPICLFYHIPAFLQGGRLSIFSFFSNYLSVFVSELEIRTNCSSLRRLESTL